MRIRLRGRYTGIYMEQAHDYQQRDAMVEQQIVDLVDEPCILLRTYVCMKYQMSLALVFQRRGRAPAHPHTKKSLQQSSSKNRNAF